MYVCIALYYFVLYSTQLLLEHSISVKCDIIKLTQTNFLFIMFDDLRPELSIYGRSHMITPNFERLAKHSVIFDYAYAQVAVCNPSRDSLLTGLRPDTVGNYNFQNSYYPNMLFPTHLIQAGYNTAGIGKIRHWDDEDPGIWNFRHWGNGWYDYQNYERGLMNSSTMPDKVRKEEHFRDYEFASKAIETLENLLKNPKYFMLAVGFKLPHLAVHVPYKYYEMYKGKSHMWKLAKKELKFPPSASEISYRGCAESEFHFMRNEGALTHNRSVPLGDITMAFTNEMHDELMMGYVAAVTFVDKQLGRLLDVLDKYKLWNNLTVVLTADHGMHNGEKGIWEKWTLFEESTRVPLLIAHPASPFHGQHYSLPVELVDVYPTILDLVRPPKRTVKQICNHDRQCKPLQGKSLAPVVLGDEIYVANMDTSPKPLAGSVADGNYTVRLPHQLLNETISSTTTKGSGQAIIMPTMNHNFAFSQTVRCAPYNNIAIKKTTVGGGHRSSRNPVWGDCDRNGRVVNETQLMGYAMRTPEYRYIVYFNYNKKTSKVDFNSTFAQELYDHKNETLADFTHRETVNIGMRPAYAVVMQHLKEKLVHYISERVKFK